MAEQKKKKGFFSAVRESMNKSGGCCGGAETCDCGPAPDAGTKKPDEKKKTVPK